MAKKRFFSGIQPTGEIHIGNYLGAIQRWCDLANNPEYEGILCVVDYHAMTMPYNPIEMTNKIKEAATMLMACGITPNNSTLFIQSQVPQHTELSWVFNCNCTVGELSRMTQFKDKSQDAGESIWAGLFTYPILQAADILLYKAQFVPVGEDQLQHLELSRDIARRFNSRFGDVFPEPQALVSEARRILGTDGERKMSKSLGNTLTISETPQETWKKLSTAKTDVRRKRREDPGIPTDCNVYNSYHRYFTSKEELANIDVECRKAGIGCMQCKKILATNMEKMLGPIRERYFELKKDFFQVESFLHTSAEKCRTIAETTMSEVRQKIGIRW